MPDLLFEHREDLATLQTAVLGEDLGGELADLLVSLDVESVLGVSEPGLGNHL